MQLGELPWAWPQCKALQPESEDGGQEHQIVLPLSPSGLRCVSAQGSVYGTFLETAPRHPPTSCSPPTLRPCSSVRLPGVCPVRHRSTTVRPTPVRTATGYPKRTLGQRTTMRSHHLSYRPEPVQGHPPQANVSRSVQVARVHSGLCAALRLPYACRMSIGRCTL